MYNHGGLLHSVPLLLLYLLTLNEIIMSEEQKPYIIILNPAKAALEEIKELENLKRIEEVLGKTVHVISNKDEIDEILAFKKQDNIIIDDAQYLKDFNVIAHKPQPIDYETVVYGGSGDTMRNQQTRKRLSQIGIAGTIPGFDKSAHIINVKSQKAEEHMKSKLSMIGMLAGMAAAMSTETSVKRQKNYYEPLIYGNKAKPKGNRFVIEGVEIYALNRKNAERKYRNLKRKS